MTERAIGLQRQASPFGAIGKPGVAGVAEVGLLTGFIVWVGTLLACLSSIDWQVILAGCVGGGRVAPLLGLASRRRSSRLYRSPSDAGAVGRFGGSSGHLALFPLPILHAHSLL